MEVRRRCSPDCLRGLRLAPGFGSFIDPSRGVEPLALAAARGDYVAVATTDGVVVGFFVAYRFALEGLRAPVAFDFLYDVVAEVARGWRGRGVASRLLDAALSDPFFEDKALLARGRPEYWDCRGEECREYARILEETAARHGFMRLQARLPGDAFTYARVGPRAPVTLEDLERLVARLAAAVFGEFYEPL
ncbi:hypothetical protein JCM10135_12010 [Stetteria hydrogenophila]